MLASQAIDFLVVWQIDSANVPCEGQQFLVVWQIDSAHVPSTGWQCEVKVAAGAPR